MLEALISCHGPLKHFELLAGPIYSYLLIRNDVIYDGRPLALYAAVVSSHLLLR